MTIGPVERRLGVAVAGLALASAAATLMTLWLPLGTMARMAIGALALASLVVIGFALTRHALRPLGSAATVAEALRDGDYALRMSSRRGGVLGELARSLNLLADTLHEQSLDRRESRLLLGKVLDEIDLPVFAFGPDGVLSLSNPAARELVGTRLHDGVTAEALALDGLLVAGPSRSVHLALPGGSGRFLVRRRAFRLGGVPHQLLVLAEVGGVLSAERNEAWQGLVRVMSHEINNSLGPIHSIAETWRGRVSDPQREIDRERLADNLELISRRAAGLSRFVGVYAGLAKLPEPTLKPVRLSELAAKVAALESRAPVRHAGPDIEATVDADQIEQALINLVRNAVEASEGIPDPSVEIGWDASGPGVRIEVRDNGPGPPDSDNLFVPFFTTKPDGSGIGLLLVRRIAELHGGWFELGARAAGPGAVARLWLPDDGAGADRAVPRARPRSH
jgi:nitrogen fixation/metabolism regulation signal transduction histidine kinase